MAVARNAGSGGRQTQPMPSASELMSNLDPTAGMYGISNKEVQGMGSLLDSRVNVLNSLPGALPIAPGSEYFDAMAIYHDDYEDLDDDLSEGLQDYEKAGNYYDPYDLSKGPAGTNFADDPRDYSDGPAPLSIIPTSSMNYKRPRTVAAGYDRKREVLTVVFRDGTFYNYHDVKATTWSSFKAAYSKGRFILRYLDSHPHGLADMGSVPTYARETLYRIARTNQIFFEYDNRATKTGGKVGRDKQKQGLIPLSKANKQKTTALKSSKGNKKKR
jgi:hypothetical protein